MVLQLSSSKRALYPRAQIESDRATHSGFLNLGLPTRCICSANKRVAGVDQGPVARQCRGYGALERDSFRCHQWPHGAGSLIEWPRPFAGGVPSSCSLAWWHRTSFEDTSVSGGIEVPRIRCR